MILTRGERLADLRKSKNLTVEQLADIVNVSKATISNIENDKSTNIKTDCIVALAKYFNVTSDYLLGLSEYKTPQAADIGAVTGLSDENIKKLSIIKNYVDGKSKYKVKNTETKQFWIYVTNQLLELSFTIGLNADLSTVLYNIQLAKEKFINFDTSLATVDNLIFPLLYNQLIVSRNTMQEDIKAACKHCEEIIYKILDFDNFENEYNNFMNKLSDDLKKISKQHFDEVTKEGDT